MRKLCYLLTWAYFFTVPWDHSLFIDGLGPISRIMTLIAIPFIAVAVIARGKIRKIRPVHAMMMVFFLVIGSTFYWSVDSDATLTAIRAYFQIMLAVWLVWEFAVDSESRRKLGVAYMLGAYVSIINTFREFASNIASSANSAQRFNADGWDQNDLAVALALGILISRYAAQGASKPIRILAFVYMPLALVAIALTGSRGGSIVAGIAILAIAVQWKGKLTVKMAALGILCAATYVGMSVVPEDSLGRIMTATTDVQDMNARVPIWRAAMAAIPAHLLLGSGAGSFPIASGMGMVAHNTFLSVLLEEGFLGFAVFLTILIMLFQSVRKAELPVRSIWTTIMICWCVGVSSLTWEQTRLTWIIFALAAAQAQAQPEFGKGALRARLPHFVRFGTH
jgi:O-antigen ligase